MSERVYAIVKYANGEICRCDFPNAEVARRRCMNMMTLDADDCEIEEIKIFKVKGTEVLPVSIYSGSSSPKI